MSEKSYILINGDALEQVKRLGSASVDCVISSPPYFALRDYGFPEQWGLESTFTEYLEKLWALMDEVWRVLKPTGTCWINLGDSYNNSSGNNTNGSGLQGGKSHLIESKTGKQSLKGIANKTLLLIPHRFAIGCSERNWIIRNDCIWAKTNAMPESVTDRFSKKHEYFFLMVKQAKYYFDLDSIRDEHKAVSLARYDRGYSEGNKYADFKGGVGTLSKPRPNRKNDGTMFGTNGNGIANHSGNSLNHPKGKNPGSVTDFWDIPTRPSSAKHYATFNTELIDKPIRAGCPEGGTILDMFCGTATTGVRALQLGRKFIGVDGSKKYLEIAEQRLSEAANSEPLFSEI